MQIIRPVVASCPRRFGRRSNHAVAAVAQATALTDDLKLFAATFAAGFLFVSILIG